jgi:hypothetical protein
MWQEWKTRSLGAVIVSRVRAWWKSFDTPDPWPPELSDAVRAPDAVPVCHRCLTPCELPVYFCPSCGAAIGRYNNVLPFIKIFSLGEVFRSGVSPSARFTPLTVVGYVLVGLQEFWFLAPFYYVALILNYLRVRNERKTSLPDAEQGNS